MLVAQPVIGKRAERRRNHLVADLSDPALQALDVDVVLLFNIGQRDDD